MDIYSFKALKGGIREYINILISLYTIYDNKDVLNTLNDLYNKLELVNDYEELNNLKNDIIDIQNNNIIDINNKIINGYSKLDRDFYDREKGLIKRGYLKEDIIDVCGYSDDDFKKIADVIISNISNECKKIDKPTCIFVGGQPGCGKSTISIKMKDYFSEDGAVEIGIDNYRSYHPNYLKMEELIKRHWKDRVRSENDSPGNDIADFTHKFAGDMTDYIVEHFINNTKDKYNLIIEWGMRTPEEPLHMMKKLKDIGYKVIVNFVVVDKESSFNACVLRADAMDGEEHIVRRIPKEFHDMCVRTIPDSCDEIYDIGYNYNNFIDQFVLMSRDGNVLWDNTNNYKPGNLYKDYLDKKI